MKESDNADGMVEALMAMSSFCDRALRAQEDGDTSPLDTEVRPFSSLNNWRVIAHVLLLPVYSGHAIIRTDS